MGKYIIEFSKEALKDLQLIKRSGKKADIKKINDFLTEIQEDPRNGTGQPEQLRYQDGEIWSRKINKKDRFIYQIYENKLIIIVISSLGHYSDK